MPTNGILAWHIYHILNCRHSNPIKDKFVIVVCVNDDHCLGFFINSRIHPRIQNNAHLLGCQTSIFPSEHRCLSHDSYIDTHKVFKLSFSELNDVKEEISDNAKRALLEAVDYCIVIEKRYKKQISQAGLDYFYLGDEEDAEV